MRPLLLLLTALLVAGCESASNSGGAESPGGFGAVDAAAVFEGRAGRWIDLTHSFSDSTIYWPTDTLGFRLEVLSFGPTPGGWFYASNRYASAEHGGTHLDAPIHFGFENLTNLSLLPPAGSFVVALPMKIKGGSGGPLRIVAWAP
jgi:kynurenine formamidase